MPRRLQLTLRRMIVASKLKKCSKVWPIDPASAKKPAWFKGWPEEKLFALLITHDVEHAAGLQKLEQLLAIDRQFGIRSSVGIVPERYPVDISAVNAVRNNGHEVYVHDLNHDGRLFSNYSTFHKRAPVINRYIKEWDIDGFRAGAMHHNLDWIGELDIKYDMSTFDTDPFEPMPDGVNTIFPFVETSSSTNRRYVEIPYTLPQDLMTLVLHPARSIDIWKNKIDWIAEHNGMALLNVHPDYIAFNNDEYSFHNYLVKCYMDFLDFLTQRHADHFWNPLPSELSNFIKNMHDKFLNEV